MITEAQPPFQNDNVKVIKCCVCKREDVDKNLIRNKCNRTICINAKCYYVCKRCEETFCYNCYSESFGINLDQCPQCYNEEYAVVSDEIDNE